jgi:hypothetical protein
MPPSFIMMAVAMPVTNRNLPLRRCIRTFRWRITRCMASQMNNVTNLTETNLPLGNGRENAMLPLAQSACQFRLAVDMEEIEMDKRIAGLLGGVAALASLDAAQAAAPIPPAHRSLAVQSYAELLEPIPNAVSLLIADDAARAQQPSAGVQLAQFRHHHHHHHHHHHGFGFGFGGIVVAPPPVYVEPGYYGDDDQCYIRRQIVIDQYGRRIVRRVRVCE